MPQETLTAHVSSWRLENDALPSPAHLSQGQLMEHAARIIDASRQQELELGKVQRSEANAAQPGVKKVKISTVADQSNHQEMTELTEDQILKAYDTFCLMLPPNL